MRAVVTLGVVLAMLVAGGSGFAADGKAGAGTPPRTAAPAPKKPPPSTGPRGEFPWQIAF